MYKCTKNIILLWDILKDAQKPKKDALGYIKNQIVVY